MPFESGPYVQAAVFCDMVIEDKSGALSLIRVIDRVTHIAHGPEAPAEMPEVRHPLKLVLMLKSGLARGRHEVKIVPELPSAELKQPFTTSVHFEGEERGQNIIMDISYPFTMEGVYWFNVYLNDTLLTKVPLRVMYHRVVTGPPPEH